MFSIEVCLICFPLMLTPSSSRAHFFGEFSYQPFEGFLYQYLALEFCVLLLSLAFLLLYFFFHTKVCDFWLIMFTVFSGNPTDRVM